jgi:hypothetical protein
MKGTNYLFIFGYAGCVSFGLSLAFVVVSPMMIPTIDLLLDFE